MQSIASIAFMRTVPYEIFAKIANFVILMAKGFQDTDSLCRELVKDARNGVFKPVYLLMGDEPYYVDMVCDAILEHCLDESEKDFNQTV